MYNALPFYQHLVHFPEDSMTRARSVFTATLVGASLVATFALAAQSGSGQSGSAQSGQTTPQAPPMQPILAGKKFVQPIKGQADVEFTKPVTKREKEMVVTRIVVKNISPAPIPRLTVDETWYGKDNQMVTGGKGVVNGLLQPGEITTIEIRTPYDSKMNANQWMFSHANGAVKTHQVKTLVDPNAKKEPAAKNASAKSGK
jgi:hypothetical protein